jgi:maltose O-acetyltransferase
LTPARIRPPLLRLLGEDVPNTVNVLEGLRFSGYNGKLVVGAGCFISHDVFIDLSDDVTIGEYVALGAQTRLVTAGHDYSDPRQRAGTRQNRPIRIDDGAWLGAGCMVLGGVTIGTGVVVAAGALVTKDCPPHGLYAGAPARRIKELPTAIPDGGWPVL